MAILKVSDENMKIINAALDQTSAMIREQECVPDGADGVFAAGLALAFLHDVNTVTIIEPTLGTGKVSNLSRAARSMIANALLSLARERGCGADFARTMVDMKDNYSDLRDAGSNGDVN